MPPGRSCHRRVWNESLREARSRSGATPTRTWDRHRDSASDRCAGITVPTVADARQTVIMTSCRRWIAVSRSPVAVSRRRRAFDPNFVRCRPPHTADGTIDADPLQPVVPDPNEAGAAVRYPAALRAAPDTPRDQSSANSHPKGVSPADNVFRSMERTSAEMSSRRPRTCSAAAPRHPLESSRNAA